MYNQDATQPGGEGSGLHKSGAAAVGDSGGGV